MSHFVLARFQNAKLVIEFILFLDTAKIKNSQYFFRELNKKKN